MLALPRGQSKRDVNLTIHLHLVPRLRTCTFIPPYFFMAWCLINHIFYHFNLTSERYLGYVKRGLLRFKKKTYDSLTQAESAVARYCDIPSGRNTIYVTNKGLTARGYHETAHFILRISDVYEDYTYSSKTLFAKKVGGTIIWKIRPALVKNTQNTMAFLYALLLNLMPYAVIGGVL